MFAQARNGKFAPLVEFLAGAMAQILVIALALYAVGPIGDTAAPRQPWTAISAFGAICWVGPQMAFILRRGDLRDKLSGAATNIGLNILVGGLTLLVAVFVGVVVALSNA